jgi:hypothetical protein
MFPKSSLKEKEHAFKKKDWGVTHVEEHLTYKCKTLNSNSSSKEKKTGKTTGPKEKDAICQ